MTGTSQSMSFEVHPSRSIVGRVMRGASLREAFAALVTEHELRTAWVSAIGAFEWIELTEYDQVERRYEKAHRFERCELLSMQGNLSILDGEPFWHLHATISQREEGRDVAYGGHVGDGVVFALEFRIECFDDLVLHRGKDPATDLQLWTHRVAPEGEASRPSEDREPAGVSWAMAAAASSRSVTPRAAEKPKKGDWIEHAKFGLCKIEGLSGEGVCIIKLPDATRKKIKLDAMRVLPPRQEADRKIFPVTPRPKP